MLDLGLARAEEEDIRSLARTGDLCGTPAFLSPEQLRIRWIVDSEAT